MNLTKQNRNQYVVSSLDRNSIIQVKPSKKLTSIRLSNKGEFNEQVLQTLGRFRPLDHNICD
jgi:hypothetical protein